MKVIGMDMARPGSDQTVLTIGSPSRGHGKTYAMRKMIDEFIRKNPDAVIAEWTSDGLRIEKPVKDLGPLALPKPESR